MEKRLTCGAPGEKSLQVLRFSDYHTCESLCTVSVFGLAEAEKCSF
jgi:hypothetical protein